MILVTRLNGSVFALNPDLIQRVDATPDTVVTLVDGVKFVITEPLPEIIDRIMAFRARVVATAHALEEMGTSAEVLELPHTRADTSRNDDHDDAEGALPAPVPLHRRRS